jgi:hypothetical protein
MKLDRIFWDMYEMIIVVVVCCIAIPAIPILYIHDRIRHKSIFRLLKKRSNYIG